MELQNTIEALDADLIRLHKTLFQHRSWVELQRKAGVDIDRAGAALLKALAHSDSQCRRLQDIAHYLGIEAPSITRKAQQLEADGLITRKPDPKDGRAYNLTVTAKGRSQLAKLQKARQAQLQKAIASWSQADRDTFIRLLHTFGEDLSAVITNTEKEN